MRKWRRATRGANVGGVPTDMGEWKILVFSPPQCNISFYNFQDVVINTVTFIHDLLVKK